MGGVILFGIPATKDETGSAAWDPAGPVPEAIRAIREAAPELVVWADVCLCEYTSHGHCGVLDGDRVDNDATLPLLARAATAYAEAGADVIAPSDMMDGRVGAIRSALDAAGHSGWPSARTRPSTPAATTGRSARRRSPPRRSATGVPTRWTPPTPGRRWSKCVATSTRAPTW